MSIRRTVSVAALPLLAASFGWSQAAPVITGSGYELPAPVSVAAGQIITFFVQGIGSGLTGPQHAPVGTTLPKQIAGISAMVDHRPAGILEVRPVSTCNPPGRSGAGLFPQTVTGCGRLTAVTLQIPFGIGSVCNFCVMGAASARAPTTLRIMENDRLSTTLELTPLADKVHILTTCDIFLTTSIPPINFTGVPCTPIVSHADGSSINGTNPARAGEVVVAYAVGLGETDPPLRTDGPFPSSTPMHSPFFLSFNFRPNALPERQAREGEGVSPLYVGSTPGFFGLYQVNFTIPPVPADTPSCAPLDASRYDPGAKIVQSNLTVSISGIFSFDGAGICVAP